MVKRKTRKVVVDMAVNYTLGQAFKKIADGTDTEAIADIARRFPMVAVNCAKLVDKADVIGPLFDSLPDYLTARKVVRVCVVQSPMTSPPRRRLRRRSPLRRSAAARRLRRRRLSPTPRRRLTRLTASMPARLLLSCSRSARSVASRLLRRSPRSTTSTSSRRMMPRVASPRMRMTTGTSNPVE